MLASNDGFSARDLSAVRRVILEYRREIEEAWREHCGETR